MENKACLGLTLATLPGVRVQPFYLAPMDVPDPMDSAREWERAVRLTGREVLSVHQDVAAGKDEEAGLGEPIFLTYSTSQSIDSLGDFVAGMDMAFPGSKKIGVIASTVSRRESSCKASMYCVSLVNRSNCSKIGEDFHDVIISYHLHLIFI